MIQDTLSPARHINRVSDSTYNLLSNFKAAFSYLDGEMMKKILTYMIQRKLEYGLGST